MTTDLKGVPFKDAPDMEVVAGDTVTGEALLAGAAATHSEVVDLAGAEVIPVLREEMRVSKREVETGRVVVRKTVSERDEAVEMLLRRTDVSVERVPVGRVVTEAPASRQEGDVTIIPILEETLVLEKRLVLREELHIRKTTSERTAHEVVRLRTEHVDIEPTGSVTVPGHIHPTQES